MKIVIIGCGRFGSLITDLMLSQGYDVVVVDSNESKIENINNMRDVLAICGNGSNYNLLDEIGMQDTDVFIACTASDETNLLASKLSKAMGAKHTIARILNYLPERKAAKFIKKELDIDLMISPDYLTAMDAYKILRERNAKNVLVLGATRLGAQLTQILMDSGMDVKVIDRDENRCERLTDFVDGSPIIINGEETDHQVLYDSGLNKADAVVSVTAMDAENIMTSLYAADCGVPLVITKIDNSSFTDIVMDLTLENIISPRISVAHVMKNYVEGLVQNES